MRMVLIAVSALALSGCQSADARFEKSFKLANGERERCQVAKEAQEYFLRSGDDANLEKWRSKGSFDCLAAQAGRF